MQKQLAIALGGALGALSRYWVGSLVGERLGTRFPIGTLLVNVTGCFIIGFLITLLNERLKLHQNWEYGLAMGFVGAYTTYSTFGYETIRLWQSGNWLAGGMNVLLSLVLGFLAVLAGIAVARV